MKNRYAIILAAGQGTRMKSKLKKELHSILGRPMIRYVLQALKPSAVDQLITVVGHSSEEVMKQIGDASEFVVQEEQLGTAHAVLQAKSLLKDKQGTTIVVCGDTPLITGDTFKKLFDYHESLQSKATILSTKVADPTGYGRVLRSDDKDVERIVEHKDATDDEKLVNEINTGTYCFDNEALFAALDKVDNKNAQQEYYLPDVIEILKAAGEKIVAYRTDNEGETMGINDRVALANAEKVMKNRLNEQHLRNGVTMIDPATTYIGPDVVIEQDVIIQPGTMILGETTIGSGTLIGPHTEIENCVIGKDSVIRQSVVKDSKIGNKANIGPFAHIRPETVLNDHARVGNFVETKKAHIGEGTKVSHLSYIGDAEIGKHTNIGCGTITVNYDGKEKHQTTIGDHAFIGCNANLIAPVDIGEGALIAAGSTITEDVPKDALAIARAKQASKEGYAKKLLGKK